MAWALLQLLITLFELAFSALVYRADPRRFENRIFALAGTVDAASVLVRVALVLDGHSLTDIIALRTCLIGTIAVTWAVLGLAYSFPFNQRPSRLQEVIATVIAAIAIGLAIHPATAAPFSRIATVVYFLPCFILTAALLLRNHRRLRSSEVGSEGRAGIYLVMGAIAFRWVVGMVTWGIARNYSPELFHDLLYFEATSAILLGQLLMGYGVLKHHLFRVRGVISEVILVSLLGLGALAILAGAIDLALKVVDSPRAIRIVLTAIALGPVAIAAALRQFRPRIEAAVLAPLDPRRSAMKVALERAMARTAHEVDPARMIEMLRSVIAELSPSSTVRYLAIETGLPPALAGALSAPSMSYFHRDTAHDLSGEAQRELSSREGDLWVPVRRGRTLFGAITLAGGELDREMALTLVALADHLALKLENSALFGKKLELEKELEETRRLAALGAFAAAIAHDIRTPLTSVQMNVQILRGKAEHSPDDLEHFDIALTEIRRLNGHISEILDFAKPVQLHAAPTDVKELVEDAVKGVELIFADREVRLIREHGSASRPVMADPERMRQVLLNLLDNAAQASPKGAAVTLATHPADERHVALEVRDNGRGIPAADLTQIFDPFFTTRPDGTGLGLAIAHKLVRAHGGEIQVRSEPGRGSTFTILLPAA